jgi:ankyrin repeat protein
VAARCGRREIVQYCITKGMSVNVKNCFEDAPLHLACGKFRDLLMVRFLVGKEVEWTAVNSLGDSCAEVAKGTGFMKL